MSDPGNYWRRHAPCFSTAVSVTLSTNVTASVNRSQPENAKQITIARLLPFGRRSFVMEMSWFIWPFLAIAVAAVTLIVRKKSLAAGAAAKPGATTSAAPAADGTAGTNA
jgi:hypothetical protein